MAGTVESQPEQHRAKALNAIIEQWEVQYARFVYYPPSSSLSTAAATHHPSIAPHPTNKRRCSRRGVWISTSSSSSNSIPSAATIIVSSATLKLIADSDDAILNLSLRGKVIEEHYISKLHFSWPQVSCVSGFPARGTRSVFLSYKDSLGQVQKFALRFLSLQETERFIHLLKEILEDTETEDLPDPEFISQLSSQSEFVPSKELSYRGEEEYRTTVSEENCGNKVSETQNDYVVPLPSTQEAMPNSQAEQVLSDFPPSFASFLMNCDPAAGKKKSKGLDEADIKSLITKYLEDSSFQDMFLKVEKVMNELGHNIAL